MSGSVDWGRWERIPLITHLDLSCDACGWPGPLTQRFGTQMQPGRWGRRLTRHSRIADGIRPKSVPVWHPPQPLITHHAVRCPGCGETTVYLLPSGEEVKALYQPPEFDKKDE